MHGDPDSNPGGVGIFLLCKYLSIFMLGLTQALWGQHEYVVAMG